MNDLLSQFEQIAKSIESDYLSSKFYRFKIRNYSASFLRSGTAIVAAIVGFLIFNLSVLSWGETPTEQARQLLNFCLANPNKCSLSVNYITGGWERHLNADRLNVLASTFKLIPLIAYAEAVAHGRINPNRLVNRDDWSRFWVGRDGGALSKAWLRLGQPIEVEVDQMVGAMMRESDNATPDWLLNELGVDALEKVIHKYLVGYHDLPKSIAAIFISWDGNPRETAIGDRVVGDYSGFETYGYKSEVESWFEELKDPSFVSDVRNYFCISLPWDSPPVPCQLPSIFISELNYRKLEDRYFTQSNTRTYNRLMTGLLERTLLPSNLQEIIESHLEWRLESGSDRFRRYAMKGGSLATRQGLTILTRTTYVETLSNAPGSDRGVRAAVTIHLRGAGDLLPDLQNSLANFAAALVEDPSFAIEVQNAIPEEVPKPDLISRINCFNGSRGNSEDLLQMKIDTFNVGTERSTNPSSLSLFLSDDNILDSGDQLIGIRPIGNLKAGGRHSTAISVPGMSPADGRFLILIIDKNNNIGESDEENNLQWERIRLP